jgi:hypothetical protein
MMGVGYQERTSTRFDPGADQRSVGELFGSVSNGVGKLLRAEMDLAKAEMTQKVTSMGKDVGMIAGGGFVAYAGFLTVIAAVVLLLGHVMPLWLSALIVGVLVIGGGYLLIRTGLTAMKKTNMAPVNTMQTMQENSRWAKEQVR